MLDMNQSGQLRELLVKEGLIVPEATDESDKKDQ